jgi:hypothetical protein
MLITSDDSEHISHVKKHLSKEFQMAGLGPLTYFLGIEVQQTPKGLIWHSPSTYKILIALDLPIHTQL